MTGPSVLPGSHDHQPLRRVRAPSSAARPGTALRADLTASARRVALPAAVPPAAGPASLSLPRLSQAQRAELDRIVGSMAVAAGLARAAHEQGHGAVVVDLDEAVHGTYAAIQYAKQAVQEGGSAVVTQFKTESALWRDDPLAATRDTALPHGGLDFGLGVGVTAVLLPLAIMAVIAGHEEMKEARQAGRELADTQRRVDAMVGSLKTLGSRESSDPQVAQAIHGLREQLQGLLAQHTQQSEDLGFARAQNRRAGQTGLGSLLSGGAIAASVAVKTGTQGALAAVAGGVGQIGTLGSAGATAAATVAGMAGTLVLGPLAAVGAIYLGDRFVRKTGEKRKHLLQDTVPTRRFLDEVAASLHGAGADARIDRYSHFFQTKSVQREQFYKNFNRLNKVFLAGGSLYGIGATGKAAIAVAALAGTTVIAPPAGLALVVALGAVGGVTMGAGSLQFLTGHQKQHRYDGYFMGNHPRLDRDFLAAVDVLRPAPHGAQEGVQLRAHLYETLRHNEDKRQDFLQEIAEQLGQHRGRRRYSTDAPAVQERKTSHSASLARRAGAGGRAVGKFARDLLQHGSVDGALDKARASYARHTDRLTLRGLADWTARSDNFPAQIDFMLDQLEQTNSSLLHRLELRQDIFPPGASLHTAPVAEAGSAAPSEPPAAEAALQAFLEKQDAARLRDQDICAQTMLLADELRTLRGELLLPAAAGAQAKVALARERFMCLQAGVRYDPGKADVDAQASTRQFAKFLMRDAPKQYKELRGLLLETEMQATRLRGLAGRLAQQAAVHREPESETTRKEREWQELEHRVQADQAALTELRQGLDAGGLDAGTRARAEAQAAELRSRIFLATGLQDGLQDWLAGPTAALDRRLKEIEP